MGVVMDDSLEYISIGDLFDVPEVEKVSNGRKKTKLGEFLEDLNSKRGNLAETNPDSMRDMVPFVINRALSQHIDCIHHCQVMNTVSLPEKSMYYHYMYNAIRNKKRYSKWHNPYIDDDIKLVMRYYKYSHEKAVRALVVLNKMPESLDMMRKSFDKGGIE